jgi:hypothetical protein
MIVGVGKAMELLEFARAGEGAALTQFQQLSRVGISLTGKCGADRSVCRAL